MKGKKYYYRDSENKSMYHTVTLTTNQKAIYISKGGEGISFSGLRKAMKMLSPTGLTLFNYLILRPANALWGLSRADVMENTPLTVTTYPNAVQELIERGYLQETTITVGNEIISHGYIFFDDIDNAIKYQEKAINLN